MKPINQLHEIYFLKKQSGHRQTFSAKAEVDYMKNTQNTFKHVTAILKASKGDSRRFMAHNSD